MSVRSHRFSATATGLAILGSFGILFAPAGRSLAAPADSLPPVLLRDTVVVVASKLSLRLADLATSASVIPATRLRRGTAPNLQDALAVVPGVHVLDLSGADTQGAIESRGFASQGTSSHTLVLVDEMPVNDFETGRVDWNLLAPAQVERIEFLRGPASFLYGDASMSGIVNLVTRSPLAGPDGWLEARGGRFGRAAAAGGFGFGGPGLRTNLSLSHQRLDGDRDHSAWDASSAHAGARATFGGPWSARGRLLLHRGDQEVPGPLPDPLWRDAPRTAATPLDRRETRMAEGALELARRTAGLEALVLASGEARDVDATETIVPGGTLDRRSNLSRGGLELRAHLVSPLPWLPHVLLGGQVEKGKLESRYDSTGVTPRVTVGAADVKRTSGAVFGLVRSELERVGSLTLGARLDWLRSVTGDPFDDGGDSDPTDLRAFSPTAALLCGLPGGGEAHLSYAGAFKAPTLEQLYDRRPFEVGAPTPITISFAGLAPQRGHHAEVGVRVPIGSRTRAEVTLWGARSRDEIGFDLAEFHHVNIDRSVHYGVESQLDLQPLEVLAVHVSHAWTRATFDGGPHDGKQINTVPEHVGHVGIDVGTRRAGTLSIEAEGVARQWIDEDNTIALPDYALVNLGASRRFGSLDVFASARNVFDRRWASLGYVTVDPATFGPLPLFFPGAGRSFQAGVRFSPFGSSDEP